MAEENWFKPINNEYPLHSQTVLCFCNVNDYRQKGSSFYEYRIGFWNANDKTWVFQTQTDIAGRQHSHYAMEVLLWRELYELPQLTEKQRVSLSVYWQNFNK